LRSRLADLDLRQDHPAGEIRARRGRPARRRRFVAGFRRLHRIRLDAAQRAALRRRPRAFVRRDRPCDRAARSRHRAWRTPAQRHHRHRRAHTGGPCRRRGSRPRRRAFSPPWKRGVPDHAPYAEPHAGMRGGANLRVLSVASEVFPLVKTGGLADVAGALPPAPAREGVAMRTMGPGFPAVLAAVRDAETVHSFAAMHGGSARILAANVAGLDVLVLDAPHLYARPGNPYVGADGREWPDNALRFAALGAAAAEVGRGCIASFVPDVVPGPDFH